MLRQLQQEALIELLVLALLGQSGQRLPQSILRPQGQLRHLTLEFDDRGSQILPRAHLSKRGQCLQNAVHLFVVRKPSSLACFSTSSARSAPPTRTAPVARSSATAYSNADAAPGSHPASATRTHPSFRITGRSKPRTPSCSTACPAARS